MKSKLSTGLMAVTALVAAMILAGCGAKPGAESVAVKAVRANIVQSISADGELSLPQRRSLTFGVSGKIEELKVEEGARVTPGQVLARLDTVPLERAVKTADLGVRAAEADRQQAEAGLKSAQADLKAAEVAVKSAQADQERGDFGIPTAEAAQAQAEYAVKTAEATREQAIDSLRKLTYPYTYSTFTVDIPTAIVSIGAAQLKLNEAAARLQPGATDYGDALAKFNEAQTSLTQALQQLAKGANTDRFIASANQTVAGTTATVASWVTTDVWTLRAAQLDVDKAQLALDTAKSTLSSSQLAVAVAKNTALKGQLGVDAARAALDKTQAATLNAQATLDKVRLSADRAKYDLETAREALANATITAPFAGVVARVNVKAGDVLTIADYTRAVFELIDPRRMEFTIKVDEMDVAGVQPGQEATVTVDALPGRKTRGKVIFVSPLPRAQGGVVQYDVKIGFDVPEGSAMRSGMSSSAEIATGQRNNTLVVPRKAVTPNKAGKPVVRLVVNGQVKETPVETGISNSSEIEIIGGLSEGDTVMTEK